ncbi:mitochondrial import inner membrane translocase subunit Tim9-like [Xenia sp. Carnegie-2017]|uniref:mitochondrial import inner membrane translocase subunit Tim9-like n=1 Tax=Xenia sp. Carnegie-2017 TaxID=2897299 RepID=UPI001F03653B|nr:mitochondrial import inner membrane translocase subunit Tim9-like [Xenia sp. Carnegie-2017]
MTLNQVGQDQDIKQIQSFLQSYNKLSESCFMDCIQDFTNRTISVNENKCVMNCAEKYLKMTQRITLRLQEQQQIQSEGLISGTKK